MMKNSKSLLDKVTVGFRCPMNWDEMAGDEVERFCCKCQKSVTDLSQMSREDAEDFVREHGAAGSACVRLSRDASGQVVTKGCGSVEANGKGILRKAAVVAVASSGLGLAACAKEVVRPPVGVICLPEGK